MCVRAKSILSARRGVGKEINITCQVYDTYSNNNHACDCFSNSLSDSNINHLFCRHTIHSERNLFSMTSVWSTIARGR